MITNRTADAAPGPPDAPSGAPPHRSQSPAQRLAVDGLTRSGLAPTSLTLERGECVGLSGPSGAGKTLLLRALADLDPNSGDVRLDGVARDAMAAPAWRRNVAYVAAESGWWDDTVGDHMADVPAAAGLLPSLGLSADALNWPVARLSTGEKQRLALARALVLAPAVLLLDEPTSGLDADATGLVETVLRRHLSAGTAILLVSHDRDQLHRLADRRLHIVGGRLAADASYNAGAGPPP
jgi:UDP-glucose/iron transport system ATP-binding protein